LRSQEQVLKVSIKSIYSLYTYGHLCNICAKCGNSPGRPCILWEVGFRQTGLDTENGRHYVGGPWRVYQMS
jgi:hypothetical protein